MQTAGATLATGQRHIERFGLQLRIELGISQRLTARSQRCFDLLLGGIDRRAAGLFVVRRQRRQRFQLIGEATGFAQVTRFRVFQIGRCGGLREVALRIVHQGFEVVHRIEV